MNLKKVIYNELRYVPEYISLLGFTQWYRFYKSHFVKRMFKFKLHGYKYPVYLRGESSDIQVFKQVFLEKEYNSGSYGRYANIQFIIDAGANCGYSTIYFANKFPNAKVIAVEPEQSNIKMLQKNLTWYSNTKIIKGGIWDKKTNLMITNCEAAHWSFQVEETKWKTLDSIKSYSLNGLMKKYKQKKIDILKMDIEGAEYVVFKKNYKHWLKNTELIFIEIHERYAKGITELINKRIKEFRFAVKKSGEKLRLRKY